MWVKVETVPEAFFPPLAVISFHQFAFLTHSLTIFPFILPTAFHLHCFHLLQRPTSEFNSTVWFIICLFISLFLVTHTIYLAFFTLVPNSLKALFFSFTLSSLPFSVSLKGDKFLSFSPSLHPFWLSCSVCLSSFTVTAPWRTNPHLLLSPMDTLWILAYLYFYSPLSILLKNSSTLFYIIPLHPP